MARSSAAPIDTNQTRCMGVSGAQSITNLWNPWVTDDWYFPYTVKQYYLIIFPSYRAKLYTFMVTNLQWHFKTIELSKMKDHSQDTAGVITIGHKCKTWISERYIHIRGELLPGAKYQSFCKFYLFFQWSWCPWLTLFHRKAECAPGTRWVPMAALILLFQVTFFVPS